MKIAIHHRANSFSDSWIRYCDENDIPYKIVNSYDTDIISITKDCDALLWHHNHACPKDVLFAKQLASSLESAGKVVFPNYKTAWHFDDKVGQKYLLEAVGAPMVPSHVYYSSKEAVNALKDQKFPIVFKLRGGSGSRNVQLIRSYRDARKMIARSFGRGFRQYNAIGAVWEQLRKYKHGNARLKDIAKAIAHIVYPIKLERSKGREAGYFYFQDFMPDNEYDTRVIVIGNKAFAIKRLVRKNDFRASGSGHIIFKPEEIDLSTIKAAFRIYKKLGNVQCIAFDFVQGPSKEPLVVEISYGFRHAPYQNCPGYWDKNLEWHEGAFDPLGFMVEGVIASVNKKAKRASLNLVS